MSEKKVNKVLLEKTLKRIRLYEKLRSRWPKVSRNTLRKEITR